MNDKEISEIVTAITEKLKSELVISKITLETADKLTKAVMKEAERIAIKVVVAISDSSAVPISVQCMEDSYIASFDIALNKSYTSVALKMSTAELKPLCNPGESLYGIQFTNNGKIVILGGGDPLRKNGVIVGGIGVSGGTEEQDAYLSAYGAKFFEENL